MYSYPAQPQSFDVLSVDQPYASLDNYDMPPKKGGSKLVLILVLGLILGGAFFLLGTDAGVGLIGGGSESSTGSNTLGSNFSTHTNAIQRLKSAVGKKEGATIEGYKIDNALLVSFAYQWGVTTSETKAFTFIENGTYDCKKDDLVPGDLMYGTFKNQKFVVVFNGWTDSSKSKYNMLYYSPSSKEVFDVSYDYPYGKDPATGEYWADVSPRCLKSTYFTQEASANDYYSRGDAIGRLENIVGKKDNPTVDGYKINNQVIIPYAYGWEANSLTAAVKIINSATYSCNKSDLVEGDLMYGTFQGNAFGVVFGGWSDSSKTKYRMLYYSPSSDEVFDVEYPYPYSKDPTTGNYWAEVSPRCLKSNYIGADQEKTYDYGMTGTFPTTHTPKDGVWGHVEDHSCCTSCPSNDLSRVNCGPDWGVGAVKLEGVNGAYSSTTSPNGCGSWGSQCGAEWNWKKWGCMPRDLALRRATSLVADRTRYSQSNYHRGGRTDCSGLMSLVYGFGYNYNTQTFRPISPSISSKMRRIDENDILPGDVIWFEYANGSTRHVVVFAGFTDSSKTSYYAFEQSGSRGATFRIIPKWYFNSSYYGPFYIIRPLYDSNNDWLCEW